MKKIYQTQKTKKLKKERSFDEAKTEIINKIIEHIKDILDDPIQEKDSTNGVGNTIKEIFKQILDEFKDFIEENKDKKSFIGGLIKFLRYF